MYLIIFRFRVHWDLNNAMGLREVILERKRENKNHKQNKISNTAKCGNSFTGFDIKTVPFLQH